MSEGVLSPEFDAAASVYTATVANDVTEVTVTAVAASNYATVSVLPVGGDSGATEAVEVALEEGMNTITVTVTAEDKRVREYTLTITREAE